MQLGTVVAWQHNAQVMNAREAGAVQVAAARFVFLHTLVLIYGTHE